MENEIFLVGYHDIPFLPSDSQEVFLASKSKTDYLVKCLLEIGYKVTIISCAASGNNDFKTTTCDNIKFIRTPYKFHKNRILRKINYFLTQKWLEKQLYKCRGKTVISYHSLHTMKSFKKAKRHANFNLILEVEEIYSDIKVHKKFSRREKDFFNIADKFIFITPLLESIVNKNRKPFCIFYGDYSNFCAHKIEKFNDNKIHIVYAGTSSAQKGGMLTSIEAAQSLPNNYILDLLISDNPEVAKALCQKKQYINIGFIGKLQGDEFLEYLSKCSIGLALQNPFDNFNKTSFPSKILQYLKCNLAIISTKTPSLFDSVFSDSIIFADFNPNSINKAILSAKKVKTDILIRTMDVDFKKTLKGLLR